jgi:AbiV family abortive infection protein
VAQQLCSRRSRREEIGRARIYLQRRKAVISGDTVTVQSLEKAVSGRGGHEKKITEAQRITGVFASLYSWGDPPKPGSPEEKRELELLDEKRRILEKERPKEAHQRKLRALYVDPAEDGSYWLRPIAEIAPIEAGLMLEEAELQYTFQRRQLVNRADDPELRAAVEAWQAKPSLPEIR